MDQMPTVAVLMSTYNGEKYIREQLDSIFTQRDVDITLYVRDDGSTDNTPQILKEYSVSGKKIIINCSDNVGVGTSFMNLTYEVPSHYDYYAFADQDDIWLSNKLKEAITLLSENKKGIYCSNQTFINKQGEIIGTRFSREPELSLIKEIQENKVTGCTIVFTRKFRDMIVEEERKPEPSFIKQQIHDIWFALVGVTTNTIIYDNNSYIYYRQHDHNVVGIKQPTIVEKIRRKISKIKKRDTRNSRSKRAYAMVTKYGDYLESNDLIRACAYPKSFKNKMIILKEYDSFRDNNSKLELIAYLLMGLF